MDQPLVSQSWYRVEQLRPCLVGGLKIVRHRVRDQLWHVLVEPASGRQLRLNPSAYAFAGRCDGNTSVASLWEFLLAQGGDDAPTQDDILRLLAQLFRAGMVQFDAAPYLSLLFTRRAEEGRQKRRAFINPLLLRMRLFDPTRLLDRLSPLSAALAGWQVLAAWTLAVALAGLACAINFPALKSDALRLLGTPMGYALAWVCYPLVKALHELGHAMAVRRFGGEVHELGLSLMFLTPAPYVDASAANAFASRRQRALVSAAGIMVELAIAAVAAFAWLAFSPGLLRDTALVLLLICSVSTLLFNANPLLRLDGYHLLCDALSLPNLALRSQAWWSAQWRRWVGGALPVPDSVFAAGETKWLVAYAPAALVYRLALLLALVFWLGRQSWLLGWIAGLGLLLWGCKALLARARAAAVEAPTARMRWRQAAGSALAAVAVAVLLFAVPAPSSVIARGVVWPPEDAQLRPDATGFIDAALLADGTPVGPGDVVLALRDPVLAAERERRASEQAGLLAQQYGALLQDPGRAGDLGEELARNGAELARLDDQVAQLQVRSRTAGRLVLPRERDLAGSFAGRGALLGYVVGPAAPNVRVVLRDEDVLRVRGRTRAIEVRLAEAPLRPLQAVVQREAAGAVRALPSAALGDRYGGAIAIDPADKDGLRTLAPVFLMDVSLPQMAAGRMGGRAWVKLALDDEPLGRQWMGQLRQLLVKQFSPAGQV